MKPDNMFWVELMEDTRKRRALILKFVIPVVLVLPFTMSQLSPTIRHSGLPLIVLFLGVLGSSVGLSRLKENGILERLSALPVRKPRLIGDYLLANVAMDAMQVVAPLALLAASFHLGAGSVALSAMALLLSLALANALGIAMAITAGSSGEVHLYSAACVFGIAGISGIFFERSSGLMGAVSNAFPFGLLVDGLSASPFSDEVAHLALSSLVTAAILSLTIIGSSRLFRG